MIIAIDGPAGSGKSTTARAVARRLGFFYLDTGAMYRAVALRFARQGLEPLEECVSDALADFELELEPGPEGVRVRMNGEDVSQAIRSAEASALASRVSQLQGVRDILVAQQRRIAANASRSGKGIVLEGRDIGTVVFPDAELKVFLTADLDVRARRRAAQMAGGKRPPGEADVRREMAARDASDSTREASPLRQAPDAVVIDTTALTFKDQVARIVALAGERRRGRKV